ncbi:M14 family zinc carboxypeptidase [Natronococcus wangiae]|uniref:M14 family zinc carboxypeptidase n=1 Tax=Natronococcus wangiae TaxID=3068275 RepID=UPI00273D6219|nr:M14 family zinc carboxypeptidase [Natronococcus sp. AD5]
MSEYDSSHDEAEPHDADERGRNHAGHTHETLDESAFDDVSIGRRQFGRLAAAVGAALALPGNAVADLENETMTDEYEYVVNHTPDDYPAPTLIRFADTSGIDDLLGLDLEVDDDWILEERSVAYAQLTTAQVEDVVDLPTAEELSYTPGSNPFWRLGYYPLGVFPQPHRSVDFVDYEQMIDGLSHLESEHGDRLNFFPIDEDAQYGESPGHYNYVSDRDDPKDVYVAELTNDVRDRESFEEKRKVMFVLGMHGLERAGVEAGTRFIEQLLRGTEQETANLLDDAVLLFLFANPDGWVARSPQHSSGWQLAGPGTGLPRAPAAPLYERGNAEIYDTNRQYPTVGWIDPAHFPSEPDPDRAVGDSPPRDVVERVPDSLGIVEHFRNYENITHGADLHGMFWNSDFILGMINQNEYTQDEFHDLYEMNRVLEADLEEELDDWETLADVQEAATGDYNPEVLFPILPETAYDYSTIWDAIGYTITGGLIGWMAADESLGGLGVTTMGFEMAYSHMIGGNVYNPELVDIQTRGYQASIRTMTEYALRDVDSSVVSDGESVAYVATDGLTRSSDDLEFASDTSLAVETTSTTVAPGETATISFDVEEGVHTLSVNPHADDGLADAILRGPAGSAVRTSRPSETNANAHHHHEPWTVKRPRAGTWTVEFTSLMADSDPEDVIEPEVEVGTLSAEGNPDPREALGFEQEEYEVTPLEFFADYDASNAGVEVVELTVDDVKSGAHHDHENLVVVHDDFAADAEYVAALDDYVEADGNLVLTDTGVALLAELESAPGVSDDDVTRNAEFEVAHLDEKDEDHPLLTDARPIQQLLWKVAPLGYAYAEEAPMTLVDPDAFESSGGLSAGKTDGQVAAGSIFTDPDEWQGIHVVGGLLPPASQENLHPFGLMNHAVSFFGHTVFTNALGFEQVRTVDGEEIKRFGDADQGPIEGEEPAFTVEGDREDSGSVFTGGQTNRTELDVDVLEPDDETVLVRDTVPENWGVDEEYGDVEATAPATNGGTHVYFGLDDPAGSYEELTHFAEAPDDVLESDAYEFGPIAVSRDAGDGTLTDREWIDLEDTDRDVTVVAEDV